MTKPATSDRLIASGVFLVVLAAYVVASPGRIDIVDGQSRFDVAFHWLTEGHPIVRDPIVARYLGVRGPDGLTYGYYGAAASLVAMPLVALGLLLGGPPGEAPLFMFSLTSGVFGALTASVLYLFYRALNVESRWATLWTMVFAFATLSWPGSTSTFDNAQHAFFALASVYLGFLSARRDSRSMAFAAGSVSGVLMLYQDYFVLLIPALALATVKRSLGSGVMKGSSARYFLFCAASLAGFLLSLAYNEWRFGSWFDNGKLYAASQRGFPLAGNPIAGLLTLLVSPGKSVFLYSPPVLLALLGFGSLFRQWPELGKVVIAATAILVPFFAMFSFAGGDWCWGPRYLLVLLSLWALSFPFVQLETRVRRALIVTVVGLGLTVQLLAIGVEHHRFFFARALNDYFWAEDPWVYFKKSALFDRPGEMWSVMVGPPEAARAVPETGRWTYMILQPPGPRWMAPDWVRQYRIFYLPRPWPLWMQSMPADQRPVNIVVALAGLSGLAAVGVFQIRRGLRLVGSPVVRGAPSSG